ncbi:MAG TPA: YoaK family protein [Gaiellaceae bacterium]|nr:YoaK family protein [Gaiellaceae bacterium]
MHVRNNAHVIVVVAPALAGVAGFVDAVGFITLRGLFVAHMSGNSVKFGVYAGGGNLSAAAPAGIAVALFIGGVAVGTVAAELASRRRMRSVAAVVLTVQVALIAAFMVYGSSLIAGHAVQGRSLSGFYALAALAVVSMGIQTSALRQLGGRTISTTYVTGVITSLTQEAANYVFWLRDGSRRDERHSFLSRVVGLGSRRDSRNRVALLAAVWLTYVGGGVLGSLLDRHVELWALALPLAVLLAVIALDLRRPIQF